MADFYIALKGETADVVSFKLSAGVRPNLPGYKFIGPYDTKKKAEDSIPVGYQYKGEIVGLEAAK